MHTQNITNATIEARTHSLDVCRTLDAIDQAITELGINPADVTPINHVLSFSYRESADIEALDDELRRNAAIRWLATHARIVKRSAHILGAERVEKFSDDNRFGVQAFGTPGFFLEASVPAALTCELVDTGETEIVPAVPAVPERVRPILERRCPESIFAGVQDEIEVMA